mmetsp:Transcript_29236/g.56600  ORF Transcript_29236/g.56600 Transcript_29236/m.56600 type:complete len:223 (+) Transcript_29236:701-1369(+)
MALGKHLHARAQCRLKRLLHQRIMGAAQNGRLRLRHFTLERIHMRPHQRLGEDHIAVFDGIDDPTAGLRLHIDANGAKGQFPLKRPARHRRRRRKERHMFHGHLAGRRVVAPLPLCKRLDQGNKNAQHPLVARHPNFLHPPQRGGRGSVARQNHQITARIKKPLHRRTGQIIDIVGRPHPIRRIGTVGEVHEFHIRQPLLRGIQHGQTAQSGIKNTNRHLVP